ncbi:helix-turn-helix transcriptional regulator [Paenibacillus sp. PL2-23]|uniref:helix-turn-helix domain-containing protein n=1 Tax=Paenibacillus sp. PL2-23 TaxID=2100729 RepID=UPI0030FAC8BA
MELHEKIRVVRKTKRISQTEVAKRAKMSVSTYNMKEMGNRPIRSGEFEEIAKALEELPEIFYAQNFHEMWNVSVDKEVKDLQASQLNTG